MKFKNILFSIIALGCFVASNAQLPEHASWSARIDSIAPDRGNIVLTAEMSDGWHIYGFDKPTEDASMFPTELSVEPSDGLEPLGDWTPSRPAAEHFDSMLQLKQEIIC